MSENPANPPAEEKLPIYFTFEGVAYTVPYLAKYSFRIALPDGRFLSVEGWSAAESPQPIGIKVITGIMATKVTP